MLQQAGIVNMNRITIILLTILSLIVNETRASHIVGGEITYRYLGDTLVNSFVAHKYEITLSIYEDCQNGLLGAIDEDDPAFLGIYDGDRTKIYIDTTIPTSSQIHVPANFSNACVSNVPPLCLYKRTFIRSYYFIDNESGYIVSYQRCCRNAAINDIIDPGKNGSTYYCIIPPHPYKNNSAVFKNYPPQIICMNIPLYYDNGATDADGDSLSYEFCYALSGGDPDDAKPYPAAPPYDSVVYLSPYTYKNPFSGFPPITIDSRTGLVTGTPNRLGRYLVTVCCNEWRNGILINTVKREFQFVVTSCSKNVVADVPIHSTDPNTYIVSCTDLKVAFENNSTGGFAYHWDFGVKNSTSDTSNESVPSFTYPDTGTYVVKLVVNPRSTCPDSITRFVKVYPKFHSAFTDSGNHCIREPLQFIDQSSASIKPVTDWLWYFGDGDSSLEQNPAHTYGLGGTYTAVLISRNIKNCVDTSFKKVVIQNFSPIAGKDTIIVKGESIHFNARGGTQYTWTPSTNLSDTSIYNPVGYYPDTGFFAYAVNVLSNYGCAGTDTIRVTVINQADFFVPSAFTPNGDGRNDIFRPVAVGYSGMNYFRVFNRWGQEVYYGTTLETGWNGFYKGVPAEMGTYYWEMSFKDRRGKDAFLKGDVTLIR